MTPRRRFLALAAALTALTACAKGAPVGAPPAPLAPAPVATLVSGTLGAEPTPERLPFAGRAKLRATIVQQPAGGAELRYRLECELQLVDGAPEGKLECDDQPELGAKGAAPPGTDWAGKLIEAVTRPSRLSAWLSESPRAAACPELEDANVPITVRSGAGKQDATRVLVVSTPEPASSQQRGEAQGHLVLDAAGRAVAGRLVARRWSRFDTEGCRLDQLTRVELELTP